MHLLATLLNSLTCYYPLDQFVATPAAEAAPASASEAELAATAIEPWLSSRFEELPPSVAAPKWHVPTDGEVLLLSGYSHVDLALDGCHLELFLCAVLELQRSNRCDGAALFSHRTEAGM